MNFKSYSNNCKNLAIDRNIEDQLLNKVIKFESLLSKIDQNLAMKQVIIKEEEEIKEIYEPNKLMI